MLELTTVKKNKVNLSDYAYEADINNRALLASLSFFEHEILQEIFFSSTKFSLHKLSRNLSCEPDQILPILKKLSLTGLLSIQDDTICVDKEVRKYFEFHMKRFDSDFKPDMEYLQGILRKAPIHVLPLWYAIPRASNNIFESIVEKYLLTPQVFQRYVSDITFTHPAASKIVNDVFSAPDCKIQTQTLKERYKLSAFEFEEIVLYLEFNFVACVTYSKHDSTWIEYLSAFHEWAEYTKFCKDTFIPSFEESANLKKNRKEEFSFVKDLGALLNDITNQPLAQNFDQTLKFQKLCTLIELDQNNDRDKIIAQNYLQRLLNKLCIFQFIEVVDDTFVATKIAADFLRLSYEKRAMHLYRHCTDAISHTNFSPELATEKNLREIEKSIRQILKKPWIYFSDFIDGVVICFNETNSITLKKVGKSWKYVTPKYSDSDIEFIKHIIFGWLFEIGIVQTGTLDGKDCFTVTSFGKMFFEA